MSKWCDIELTWDQLIATKDRKRFLTAESEYCIVEYNNFAAYHTNINRQRCLTKRREFLAHVLRTKMFKLKLDVTTKKPIGNT